MFDTATAQSRLQLGGLDGVDAMKAQVRTVELGEMIFNLQVIPCFHEWVRVLANRDLDSAVAEIEAAKLLAQSNMLFQFVPMRGKIGSDYEMDR